MNQIENTLTSMEVAEMVGKDHKNVIRDIRRIIDHLNESKNELVKIERYFSEDTYRDEKGEVRPCYRLTKKGCELYATRMTGAKGTQFAANYIERFNQMEEHIKQEATPQPKLDYSAMKHVNLSNINTINSSEFEERLLTVRFSINALQREEKLLVRVLDSARELEEAVRDIKKSAIFKFKDHAPFIEAVGKEKTFRLTEDTFDLNGSPLRMVYDENDSPWFVGKDLAALLGYDSNKRIKYTAIPNKDKMAITFKDYEHSALSSLWSGNDRLVTMLVTKAGLYQLIEQSTLSTAAPFKKWLEEEKGRESK